MKEFLKSLYQFLPFKRELFLVLKQIWHPKENVYRHLHFKGVISVDVDKTRKFKMNHYGFQLENEIFWAGLTEGWEKESIKLWIRLCEQSDVVLDVGANTGVYSLIAKAVRPNARVFAFEPVARVFKKLRENIALNQYDILPVEKALSNSDGTAVIYDTPDEHTYSVTVNKNTSGPNIHVFETKIETITLNTFIRRNALEKIDLIKIDVETHEPEVLEGFSDYLSAFRPAMLIEVLNDEIGEKVDRLVQGLGYLYFNIDEHGAIDQVDRIVKSHYYNYLLCSPEMASKIGLV